MLDTDTLAKLKCLCFLGDLSSVPHEKGHARVYLFLSAAFINTQFMASAKVEVFSISFCGAKGDKGSSEGSSSKAQTASKSTSEATASNDGGRCHTFTQSDT